MQVFNSASSGDSSVLKKLLNSNPAAVNAKHPKTSQTPLHVASQAGQLECVTLLLQHEAPHEASDKDGSQPIHLAAEAGHVSILQELVKGARKLTLKKLRTSDGSTPLHMAVSGGHLDAVIFLVEAGARIEAKDKAGRTCLDLASALGNDQIVRALVEGGAAEPMASPQAKATLSNVATRPTSAAPPPRPSTAISRAQPSISTKVSGAGLSPSPAPAPAPAAKNDDNERLLELGRMMSEMRAEIVSLKDAREKERIAHEKDKIDSLAEKNELMSRIAELEVRLLSHEDRLQDSRARVERVEEGLKETRESQGKNSLVPLLQDSIKVTRDSVGECQEGLTKLDTRVQTLIKEIDAIRLNQSPAGASSDKDLEASMEAHLKPITSRLKSLADKVGSEVQLRSGQLEALTVKVEKMEALVKSHTPAPRPPLGPPLALQLTATATEEVSSPHMLSPALNSSRRQSGGFGEPTTPSHSAGQGFVSRQEFENSMKRVEERAREAVEKEASAKNMSRLAISEEEHWSSWRQQRESAEKGLKSQMTQVEIELEAMKLSIGQLEGKVEGIEGLVSSSPSSRRG